MEPFEQLKGLATAFREKPIDESLAEVDLLLKIYDDLKNRNDASKWHPFRPVILSLLENVGLLPYVAENMKDLSLTDVLHLMPYEMEDGKFFHHGQIQVLAKLLDDKVSSLAVVAPTSFGKTKLVDYYIEKKQPKKVIIIQPTIALLQETFFRLKEKFKNSDYQICMDQEDFDPGSEKWISIWTQERCLEWLQANEGFEEFLDLFVIDEFYLIDPNRNLVDDDSKEVIDERSEILRYVYKNVKHLSRKTLLLGPVADEITTANIEMFKTEYTPVRQDIIPEYEKWATGYTEDEIKALKVARLVEIVNSTDEGLLIFRTSPSNAQELAKQLLEKDIKPTFQASNEALQIITWLRENYTTSVEDWTVFRSLTKGIGIHHGRMPRSLQKIILWLFNEGHLHSLIMTPTITQGVNTIAKTLVYWKSTREGTQSVDYFAYKNIIGRAGRLGCHITGKVHLFDLPPESKTISIDIPDTDGLQGPLEGESDFAEVDDLIENTSQDSQALLNKFRPKFPGLRFERLDRAVEIVNENSEYISQLSFKDLLKAENKPFTEQLLSFCGLEKARDHFKYRSLVSAFKTKTQPEFIEKYKGGNTDWAYDSFFDTLNNMQFQFPKGVGLLLTVAAHNGIMDGEKSNNLLKQALYRSRFQTHASVYALEEQGIPFHITHKLLSSKNKAFKILYKDYKDPTIREVKLGLLNSQVREELLTDADVFIIDEILELPAFLG